MTVGLLILGSKMEFIRRKYKYGHKKFFGFFNVNFFVKES